MINKTIRYVLVPAVAALTLSAGEAAQADSFSLYFGSPGAYFGYDSGHHYRGHRYGHRPYYKRRHTYKHYYGGPYRGWNARRHWRGHRYYNPRRHYWHKRYEHRRGHRNHGWR